MFTKLSEEILIKEPKLKSKLAFECIDIKNRIVIQ